MASQPVASENTIEFDSIRHRLQTGDILLFSGRSLISLLIRLFTVCRWSHIGIVVRDPGSAALYLWEATSNNVVHDVDYGYIPRGVQLVRLEDKLRCYDGVVAVRLLTGVERNPKLLKRFSWIFKRLRRAPYRNYVLEFLMVGLWGQRRGLQYAFCSQLVAETYMRMRLLRPVKPSALYTPRDFSSEGTILLRRGCLTALRIVQI